jgi:hypothetical protein
MIPTIFDRDRRTGRVADRANPDCSWVFAGEGRATQKLDGIACLVRDGVLWRRYKKRFWQAPPAGFLSDGSDAGTRRAVGWVPVGAHARDARFRSAFALLLDAAENFGPLDDGTFELLGPGIKGNPEHTTGHVLVRHRAAPTFHPEPPRSFDTLRAWLKSMDIEGLVYHHSDGRMAQITLRDFGLKRSRAGLLSSLFGPTAPKTLVSIDLDA